MKSFVISPNDAQEDCVFAMINNSCSMHCTRLIQRFKSYSPHMRPVRIVFVLALLLGLVEALLDGSDPLAYAAVEDRSASPRPVAFFEKPFDEKEFLEAVHKAVEGTSGPTA